MKVLDWEEYQDALARLCGLATVLTKYRVRRESLCEEVEGALQVTSDWIPLPDLYPHPDAPLVGIRWYILLFGLTLGSNF